MAGSLSEQNKTLVKRNQVADQCNRISHHANAGVFPRLAVRPTPWCHSPRDSQSTVATEKEN